MAKIYGLFGSMTGKLADTVMSVRNGEQLARKYQPVVYNPSTPAQVAQRAKMKLMSQLSAVMAPAIAIRREGAVSSRNLFTKINFGAASFADNTASIDMAAVKLTKSVVALPQMSSSRDVTGAVTVLMQQAPAGIDKVVYVAISKETDEELRYAGSIVAEAGVDGKFETTLDPHTVAPLYLYAYGIRINSEAARTVFGNLTSPTAEDVAKILVTSTLTESDVTLTETVSRSAASPA